MNRQSALKRQASSVIFENRYVYKASISWTGKAPLERLLASSVIFDYKYFYKGSVSWTEKRPWKHCHEPEKRPWKHYVMNRKSVMENTISFHCHL